MAKIENRFDLVCCKCLAFFNTMNFSINFSFQRETCGVYVCVCVSAVAAESKMILNQKTQAFATWDLWMKSCEENCIPPKVKFHICKNIRSVHFSVVFIFTYSVSKQKKTRVNLIYRLRLWCIFFPRYNILLQEPMNLKYKKRMDRFICTIAYINKTSIYCVAT